MTPKLARWIGATGLLAVALVPLAAAAASNGQAGQTTGAGVERGMVRSVDGVLRATHQRASIIVVDETIISGRVRTPAERETAAITAEECPGWRQLVHEGQSRTSDPSRVRICDVPIQDDESPGASVAPPGSRPIRSVMVFEHGPAETGAR